MIECIGAALLREFGFEKHNLLEYFYFKIELSKRR